jgi:hypothetical protein
MRKTLFALAASALIAGVAFVGCGDDSVSVGDMAGKADGPITGGDIAMAKVGCAGYVQCYTDCFAANPDTATASGCRTMCAKIAKSGAADKFDNALSCGQEHCLGDLDAMNGKCKLVITGSSGKLVNQDGTEIMQSDPTDGSNPQKACGACLNDSLARLFGDTCVNMSSADCNPTECKSLTDSCLNDMP